MAFRLTFRCTILLFILVLLLQVLLLGVYFNFIPFDNVAMPFKFTHHLASRPNIKRQFSATFSQNLSFSCDIKDRQAISALSRMQTEQCQQNCIDVYCNVTQSTPWPIRLTSKCSHYDVTRQGHLHGCFAVDANMMLQLISNNKNSKTFNQTHQSTACIAQCLQFDYEYAAVHSTHRCVCSNNAELLKSNASISCDPRCFNSLSQCPDRLLVYLTGLQKVPFFFPKEIPDSLTVKPRIVFLLLVNGRSLFQVHRLLRNLYSTHHYYYIHVDLRHNYLFNELLVLETKFSNIKLARNRFASIWGGSSLLRTILTCIRDVFNVQLWRDWDFILNLSETDFPIKQIADLEKYLSVNLGRNFVKSHGKNTFDFVQMQAANKIFIECENHMWRIANRNLIEGIVWDGGSDWVILSRNFSHYVTHGQDHLLTGLKSYFQYSLLPAESFFHVVLRNTEFCSTIVNNNLRLTNWNRKKGCKCQHKNVVDWCGCSPNAFRHKDASRLTTTQSRPFFFARKFEHVVDSDIIDFVEQSLLLNGLPMLDESVYMENVFSSEHDYPTTLSQSKLHFYKNHGRELKKLLAQSCHSSSLDKLDLNFQESNVYFKNNKFYGLLLKFSTKIERSTHFEVIMRKDPNDALLLPSALKPKLKSLKICNRFDVKEEMFRDFECFLHQFSDIEVLHEWELFFGHYNLTFVFLNPNNDIIVQQMLTINNTKAEEDSIKRLFRVSLSPYPMNSGMWKLVVINQVEVIAALKFVVAQSEQQSTSKTFSSEIDNSTVDSPMMMPLANLTTRAINAFLAQHKAFFSSSSSDNQSSLWNLHLVCYEEPSASSSKYPLQCDKSRVMPCRDTKWSSSAVQVRYLLTG